MKYTKLANPEFLSRRDFLRASGGCAALTSTSILSTLLNLHLTRSAAAAQTVSGYKALVCLFQHGGNDSFNMLVPTDPGAYADYQTARGNLALAKGDLLQISDRRDGRKYGLHPGMAALHQLYQDRNLAFVANVGTLVEPITRSSYDTAMLPLGLFSHSDQQRHWQTSVPQSRTQITGWCGRMADMLSDTTNSNPVVSMNIALEHLNILQTGDGVIPYVIDGASGAELLAGYGNSNPIDRIMTRATDSLLEQKYSDLLQVTHAQMRRQAIDAAVDFNEAIGSVNLNTTFPDTQMGRAFYQAARTIGAREVLGQQRQVLFVERGGWDHHDGVLTRQAAMLPEIAEAMKAFYDATVELGVSRDVVTFSISDFGRTLTTNGNGSDHAWGGNHIVMGEAVDGGRIHGDYPESLAPGNKLDIGRGRLIPTTSADEYNAELALWFGIENDHTLETILPNLRNFYPAFETSPPVGFVA